MPPPCSRYYSVTIPKGARASFGVVQSMPTCFNCLGVNSDEKFVAYTTFTHAHRSANLAYVASLPQPLHSSYTHKPSNVDTYVVAQEYAGRTQPQCSLLEGVRWNLLIGVGFRIWLYIYPYIYIYMYHTCIIYRVVGADFSMIFHPRSFPSDPLGPKKASLAIFCSCSLKQHRLDDRNILAKAVNDNSNNPFEGWGVGIFAFDF